MYYLKGARGGFNDDSEEGASRIRFDMSLYCHVLLTLMLPSNSPGSHTPLHNASFHG